VDAANRRPIHFPKEQQQEEVGESAQKKGDGELGVGWR